MLAEERPKTRADCEHVPRPCPWHTCRHHLDPEGRGATKSCVLDCIDEARDDVMTLQEVAEIWGYTRERIRQIEAKAISKLWQRSRRMRLSPVLQELFELLSDDVAERHRRGRN